MIEKMIKELDEETKEILEMIEEPAELSIIKIDNTEGNLMYMRSIERKGKELGINILHGETDTKNVLVLKPERKYRYFNYRGLKIQLGDQDIEGKYQKPTIKAVTALVEKITSINIKEKGKGKTITNILVMNRSEDLGRPLAHKLLDRGYTLTMAHSESVIYDYNEFDLIITATGENQDHIYGSTSGNWWLDLSYDISSNKQDKKLVQGIGRLTTSYLFNMVAKRYI